MNDGVVHLPGAFRQQVEELREAFRETMEKPGASGTLLTLRASERYERPLGEA